MVGFCWDEDSYIFVLIWWSGFGMATVDLNTNKIPPGGFVQNCRGSNRVMRKNPERVVMMKASAIKHGDIYLLAFVDSSPNWTLCSSFLSRKHSAVANLKPTCTLCTVHSVHRKRNQYNAIGEFLQKKLKRGSYLLTFTHICTCLHECHAVARAHI